MSTIEPFSPPALTPEHISVSDPGRADRSLMRTEAVISETQLPEDQRALLAQYRQMPPAVRRSNRAVEMFTPEGRPVFRRRASKRRSRRTKSRKSRKAQKSRRRRTQRK